MAPDATEGELPGLLLEKFALGIIATLICAGVVGLFYLAVNVEKLDERVGTWTTIYE